MPSIWDYLQGAPQAPPPQFPQQSPATPVQALTQGLAADPTLGQTSPGVLPYIAHLAQPWINRVFGPQSPGSQMQVAYQSGYIPTTEQQVPWAVNQALASTTRGTPFSRPGALGVFGGRMAVTADQQALTRAMDMAAGGASREDIWNKTGWFKGPDDKWRFEIPDTAAKLNPVAPTLGQTLEHDPLFAAYPQLRAVETTRGPSFGNAQFSPASGQDPAMITMGPTAGRPTMLHEVQHGVQQLENFATGGNALGLRPNTPAWGIYQERLNAIRDSGKMTREEFSQRAGYPQGELAPTKDYNAFVKSTRNIAPDIDRAAQEYAVKEAYRRLAGEVEARNVATRSGMTPEQLRATPPWRTQDVPDAQQILAGVLPPTIASQLVPTGRPQIPIPYGTNR